MCGIAGLLDLPVNSGSRPVVIGRMLGKLRHRGPDETGYFIDDRFAMGTVRLSIIDLATGSQPLSDESGLHWICCNGELYNYRELRKELEAEGVSFRTSSDTEVVLAAYLHWGEEALPRMNGAFAFAVYDSLEGTLFLARDRFGKRPLFYAEHDRGFCFASEMKAFLEIPGFTFEEDPAQIASILGQWTPLPDQTGFRGIRQLPMGETLTIKDGELIMKRYASLRLDEIRFEGTEADAVERIQASLEESVNLRLRSDVEVGVYLSGGVDSAIIAALANRLSGHPLSTFSVAFEDKHLDESESQRELASFFGSRHETIRISSSDIARNFPDALFHAEVPAFRTAFVPMFLLSRKVRDCGLKVVLTGEGADEAFLGYDLFKETILRGAWDELDISTRKERLAKMYPYLDHHGEKDRAHLLGLYQQFTKERLPGLFSHEIRFQNGRFAARLMKEPGEPFRELMALVAAEPGYAALTSVQKAQWLEFRTLLAGYLLSTQGERMSLAHGVENRCPFLDAGVVAFASGVNLRFDDGFEEKRLLRKAFEKDLPASVVARKKHPYRAPDSAAFVEAKPEYLELLLSDAEMAKLGYLDAKFARALVTKIFSTPPDRVSTRENQAFVFLLSLLLLHRFFVEREGHPHGDDRRVPARVIDRRTWV